MENDICVRQEVHRRFGSAHDAFNIHHRVLFPKAPAKGFSQSTTTKFIYMASPTFSSSTQFIYFTSLTLSSSTSTLSTLSSSTCYMIIYITYLHHLSGVNTQEKNSYQELQQKTPATLSFRSLYAGENPYQELLQKTPTSQGLLIFS